MSNLSETEISKTQEKVKTVHDKDDKHKCSPHESDPTTEVILPSPSGTDKSVVSPGKQPVRESGYHIPEVKSTSTEFVSENEYTFQRPHEFVVSGACTDSSLDHGYVTSC